MMMPACKIWLEPSRSVSRRWSFGLRTSASLRVQPNPASNFDSAGLRAPVTLARTGLWMIPSIPGTGVKRCRGRVDSIRLRSSRPGTSGNECARDIRSRRSGYRRRCVPTRSRAKPGSGRLRTTFDPLASSGASCLRVLSCWGPWAWRAAQVGGVHCRPRPRVADAADIRHGLQPAA
jgi:hypothetical protein